MKPAEPLSLDEAPLRREVATRVQQHCVAALKHVDDIAGLEATAWAALLCSGKCFVEAIFVGDVMLEHIAELRLKQDEMRRLSDLAFEAMLGTVTSADLGELEDFESCMKSLKAREVVAQERGGVR